MATLILILCSYLLGSVLFGQIVGFFSGKVDLRTTESGNVGARNAGRLLGKKAFFFTVIGDAGKGAAVVLLAKYFEFSTEFQLLALLAVLIGHLFPITLKFKGGKGVATFCGAFLSLDPLLFLVFVCIFFVFYALSRSVTIAGMSAIFTTPFLLMAVRYSFWTSAIMIFITLLITWAHRDNLKERLKTWS
ncbi:glycerol-3-phosphate acyltransferase [Bacillus fonticola]|uniref:glycerol-3-phosphate acyltransferase n=1 Tax=Bacillus fonticola TaxID=2728853 RepID=UPI0014732119|nr:glycerol-3-phosphate acyltransferase [Bacillus fonticola]